MRNRKSGKKSIKVDTSLAAFTLHAQAVLNSLEAIKRYGGQGSEMEFNTLVESIKSEEFSKLYRQAYEDFYIKYSKSTSRFSLFSSDCGQKRIPAEYNNLENFYEEIYKIRAITDPTVALEYHDIATTSFYAAPKSRYLALLLTEIHLKVDTFLTLFVKEKVVENASNQAKNVLVENVEEREKEEEKEKGKGKEEVKEYAGKKSLWEGYETYIKLYFAAHALLLPKQPEVHKDDFLGTPGSSNGWHSSNYGY